MISIHVEGEEKLAQMPPRLEENIPDYLLKLAQLCHEEIRSSAPVRSGKVRDSFGVKSEDRNSIIIFSDWFIARLQNYGYAEHFHILPSGAKVLIPGKPKREEGYFVEPSIKRVLEKHADGEFKVVVDKL